MNKNKDIIKTIKQAKRHAQRSANKCDKNASEKGSAAWWRLDDIEEQVRRERKGGK